MSAVAICFLPATSAVGILPGTRVFIELLFLGFCEAVHAFAVYLFEYSVYLLLALVAAHVVALIYGGALWVFRKYIVYYKYMRLAGYEKYKTNGRHRQQQYGERVLRKCPRVQQQCHKQACERTAKMCIVTCIAGAGKNAVDAVGHVYKPPQPAGYGNGYKEHTDLYARQEGYGSKDETSYAARCTGGAVVGMMAVNKERQQVATHKGSQVDDEKIKMPNEQLQRLTKEIERQHIEDKVRPAVVQKAGADEPEVLLTREYLVYTKGITVEEGCIPQPLVGDQQVGNDEQIGNICNGRHGDKDKYSLAN